MLRKILKSILIVLVIGYCSVFIRGFNYHSSNSQNNNDKESLPKQQIINEDIISDLIEN